MYELLNNIMNIVPGRLGKSQALFKECSLSYLLDHLKNLIYHTGIMIVLRTRGQGNEKVSDSR